MRWRHRAINRRRIATIPGLEGPWPDAVAVGSSPGGIPVVVARVNTVSRTLLEETLASGRVSDHPPRGASLEAVVDELVAQLKPWTAAPALRILVLHHPPHPFGTTPGKELTTAVLEDGDVLADRLRELRVQLVVAGHRHKLDPAYDVANGQASAQPPLRRPTVQLVAESPTQDSVAPTDDETDYDELLQPNSFCRYRLWAEDTILAVERTVFRYTDGTGTFSPGASATVFEGISLE